VPWKLLVWSQERSSPGLRNQALVVRALGVPDDGRPALLFVWSHDKSGAVAILRNHALVLSALGAPDARRPALLFVWSHARPGAGAMLRNQTLLLPALATTGGGGFPALLPVCSHDTSGAVLLA
jgi:hypothetical protein